MKTLAESPRLRLLTLSVLYVSQGIPFGFVTIALAAHLSTLGWTIGEIGFMMGMCTLPWSFKWMWGPIIDRFGIPSMGRRRPWILGAQGMMGLTILAMLLIPDLIANPKLFGMMVFVHNCFSSLQDVSVDALAVDLLEDGERGRANGFMYGSSYLGAFIGGAGLGLIITTCGLTTALIVQGIVLLLIMLWPFCTLERPGDCRMPWSHAVDQQLNPRMREPANKSTRELFRNLYYALSRPAALVSVILALSVKLGIGMLSAVSVVFLIQTLGWTQEEYTSITAGGGLIFGFGGAIAGGFIADYFGPRLVALWVSVLLGLTWIIFASGADYWHYRSFVAIILYAEILLAAILSVALFSIFMSVSWSVVAATQFTVYMACLNLSNTCGAWFAGFVGSRMSVIDTNSKSTQHESG